MTTEDYVSYPIALALKKAGFDEPCDHCYAKTDESKHELVCMTVSRDYNKPRDGEPPFLIPICSAVPLWQAQKWLRDIFLLHVCANPTIQTRKWQFYIDDLNQHINPHDGELMTRWDDDMQEKADEHFYDTYESALSAGIAAALELIEKEGE